MLFLSLLYHLTLVIKTNKNFTLNARWDFSKKTSLLFNHINICITRKFRFFAHITFVFMKIYSYKRSYKRSSLWKYTLSRSALINIIFWSRSNICVIITLICQISQDFYYLENHRREIARFPLLFHIIYIIYNNKFGVYNLKSLLLGTLSIFLYMPNVSFLFYVFYFFHHARFSTATNTGSRLSEKTLITILVPGIRCTVKPSVTAKPESYELGNNLIKSKTQVGSTVWSDKSA